MEQFILSSLTLDDLKTTISQTVRSELEKQLKPLVGHQESTEFISRKDTAKFLGVSLPTIDQWTRSGKLTGYRIGSRVRYKRIEVEQSLSAIKSKSVEDES